LKPEPTLAELRRNAIAGAVVIGVIGAIALGALVLHLLTSGCEEAAS
jgi:hypothetical protein